jgi:hypothetical protein
MKLSIHLSSAEVKNAWRNVSTPHTSSKVSLRDLFHTAVRISDYTIIEDYELDGFGSGCGLF